MKKLKRLLLFTIFIYGFSQGLSSQVVFYEDFGFQDVNLPGWWPFPASFLKRNVDNHTPDPSINWVNEAWELNGDFANVSDVVAYSTSWYTPINVANDWMWTPLIGPLPANSVLSWNAKNVDPAYPDGYEVRIMTSAFGPPTGGTGVIGNQITSSTIVFSTPAEQVTWINHQVDINAYTGQSIYVGFRNNSSDKYLLAIDDIKIEVILSYDAHTSINPITEYTLIPKSQVSALPIMGNIMNDGFINITNVGMRADVFDGTLTQIFTSTSPIQPSIAPTANANFDAGTWTPPNVVDTYTIKIYPVLTETDGQPLNDTITRIVVITDSTYARDEGAVIGQLGIGAGNGGFMGQEFAIYSPARITSIDVYCTAGYTGERFGAVVWDMSGGFPNAIVAYTDTLLYPDDSASFYTIPIDGGDYLLNTGNYAVTLIEFDSTLRIGLTNSIFTTNRTWIDWPTNGFSPWGNNEDYGGGFAKTYVIRPNISPPCPADIIVGFSTTTAGCGLTDGTATVTTTGTGPFTYSWNSGGTAAMETALGAGADIVVVTDSYSFCSEIDTVTIYNSNPPFIDSVSTTDPLCFIGNTGSATAFVSGGTPGYTYLWTGGDTTATINNLASGNYTLTVTDTVNCQVQTTFTLTAPTLLTSSANGTPETCAGCNDGTATATPSGGTAAYTYSWAPSGDTTAIASGLAPGVYTVTVTDWANCTATTTVTIEVFIFNSIKDEIGLYKTQVYPNPSSGIFNVKGTVDYRGPIKIEIFNILGEPIYNSVMDIYNELNTIIELHSSSGIYLLRITAGENQTIKEFILK